MRGAKPPQRPNKTGAPRRAYQPTEVADMLGIDYDSVLRLIHAKKLHAVKAGRYYLIPDFALEAFLRGEQPAA